MANTINADNGVSSGSAGLKSSSDGTGILALQTNGTTAVTVDASQNVGIGTSSPTSILDVRTANDALANVQSTGTIQSAILNLIGRQASADNTWSIVSTGSGLSGAQLRFTRGGWTGTPSMLIDSSGNVVVNATSQVAQGKFGVAFVGSTNQAASFNETSGAGSWTTVLFQRLGTTIGSISNATSSTAYNTSSDYRLKNTIAPMTGALAKVQALKPVTYKWNIDDEAGEGFIAHELAEVCPHAVTGEKDAVDADGNPVYQGIDTSFLVATLTAAIQELKGFVDTQASTITALTARIEALEAK